MKKKILSVISLVLAVIMVLPVAVFAADPAISSDKYHDGGTSIVVYDGGTKNSVKLSVPGETVLSWYTEDSNLITVAADGTVTAKALSDDTARTATVYAGLGAKGTVSATVTVKKYKVNSIEVKSDTKTSYVVGQMINKSDIHVDAKYSDNTVVEDITDFTFTPTSALKTTDKKLEVTYSKNTNLKDHIAISVADVGLEDFVSSIEITAPAANKEYGVGDILKPEDIQIKINNIGSSSTSTTAKGNSDVTVSVKIGDSSKTWNSTSGYTFSNEDITSDSKKCIVTVEYAGKKATVELKVKSGGGSTTTPSAGYTASVVTAPTKKEYNVGDKLNIAGASFQIKLDGTAVQVSIVSVEYEFTSADVGKTEINPYIVFTHNGVVQACAVKISGLTVKGSTSYVDEYPIQILKVDLKNEKYPVGYVFSVNDIDSIWARFPSSTSAYGTLKTVTGAELLYYVAYLEGKMDLEVLDADGDRKSLTRSHKLQEEDVVSGEASVLFIFGDESYKTTITVGNPDVSFIFDGAIVAEYDSIEDALEYTVVQDKSVESVFKLSSLKTSDYITIKLGKSFKFSGSFEFNPSQHIVIDLNGYNLTMDSDQIEIITAYRSKTVVVQNTSSTEAKLIYDDKDVEIVLADGESVVFEYNKDVPGLYTVTVNEVNNGKVSADYEIDDGEIVVGYGSDIEFKFTPNSGYVIDSLKVGTTVIAAKDYTVATNGVVTYKLKDITKDVTVYVTFKKGSAADDWTNPFTSYTTNPFTDVYKTSTYYSAVRFVYTNGLFQGTETRKFEPNTTMTRAMFVTVIGRLAEQSGITVTKYTNSSYTDVVVNKDTSWYTPYIEWATRNGVIQGHGDGTFGPDDEITHEQMYKIMYNYAMFVAKKNDVNVTSVSITSISDRTSISDWAVDAVKYAIKNDFVVYTSGSRIAPAGDAKRSELAQLLEMYCQNVLGWEE